MGRRRFRPGAEALAAAMRAHAATIPGVTAVRIAIRNEGGYPSVKLDLHATIWSESLQRRRAHVLHMRPFPDDGGADLAAAEAAEALGGLEEVQTARHRIATAHGLEARAGFALDPGAILVDRATADLLARRKVSPRELVRLHRTSVATTGSRPSTTADGLMGLDDVAVTCGPDHDLPILSVTIPLGNREPRTTISGVKVPNPTAYGRGTIHGTKLNVDESLPETVLAATIGRRLGDVVATGNDLLDDRVIASATSEWGGAGFALAPDLVTIAEVDPARPRSPVPSRRPARQAGGRTRG